MDIQEEINRATSYAESIPLSERLSILQNLEKTLSENLGILLQELLIFELQHRDNPENVNIIKSFVECSTRCFNQQNGLRLVQSELQRLQKPVKKKVQSTGNEDVGKVVNIDFYRNMPKRGN